MTASSSQRLPDDLTIKIGLLIKKGMEGEIKELRAQVMQLRRASLEDVQTVLYEECARTLRSDEIDEEAVLHDPFPITKALLSEKEDWLSVEDLFTDALLVPLGPLNMTGRLDPIIYKYLLKEYASHPRSFSEQILHYTPDWSSDEEDEDDEVEEEEDEDAEEDGEDDEEAEDEEEEDDDDEG